ncbi:Lrp/AsnC family transcriptional regulator [Arthrobacter sp. SLBN-122]|uniref:Lrp/AsnC family transcriptional regulator n=1 Tax=Arthrobacter sp. SLBN-122 TaxID=2768455 RepID=UPI0011503564|nr:Lrp/AsnC family transcriptional regulator [Arthrobacter sp. SLBN-122]TQJ34203.1 AsnC family transcriptional regulator [Arthrobacter sp. SLBN-122]
MDRIDREILALLQLEGRISFTELAGRVQLSLSSCQRRVRDLEARGIIRSYRAVVDAASAGFGFEVVAFATLTRPDVLDEFDAAISHVPEIIEAQRLFGEPDYMIRIVAADREAYQKLYDKVLSRLPGVQSLNSTIVMKEVIASRALPVVRRSIE